MQPRASRARVDGLHGTSLRVRVQAPPADGRANDAVRELLAGAVGVPARDVELLAGHKGRHKRVKILGDPAALEHAIRSLIEPHSSV